MAPSGGEDAVSSRRITPEVSLTSARATWVRAFFACSSPAASAANAPLLEASTNVRPARASHRAVSRPRPPVPPVMMHVVSDGDWSLGVGGSSARAKRGTSIDVRCNSSSSADSLTTGLLVARMSRHRRLSVGASCRAARANPHM
eukprot:1482933-Prymnesium_polylepis.2